MRHGALGRTYLHGHHRIRMNRAKYLGPHMTGKKVDIVRASTAADEQLSDTNHGPIGVQSDRWSCHDER